MSPQLKIAATHVFFKKNAVMLFNRMKMDEREGDVMRFDATYEGDGEKV